MFEKIETLPAEQASASVIWLHGLGASGEDFVELVSELDMSADVRFVFPHAPVMPVTINGGMSMPAWFDIISLERDAEQDEEGIRQASAQLVKLLEQEINAGIPPERIVLMGFSQGGALALYTGLRYDQPLAGMIGLSCYLPLAGEMSEAEVHHPEVPVGLAHGLEDTLLPPEMGDLTRERLQELGFSVDWQTYPMAHQVCWQEVRQIGAWLHVMLK